MEAAVRKEGLLQDLEELLDGNEALAGDERRSDERRRVSVRAKVSGVGETEAIDCFVRDASHSGCRIFSNYAINVPEYICLAVAGISRPIRGQIVWRNDRMAGVKFIWDEAEKTAL